MAVMILSKSYFIIFIISCSNPALHPLNDTKCCYDNNNNSVRVYRFDC